MRDTAERMYILQLGAERVGKSLSIRGEVDTPFWAPFLSVLVETSEGLILFDTGMSRATHEAADVEAVYRPEPTIAPDVRWHLHPAPPVGSVRSTWGLAGDPLVSALAAVGLSVGDLTLAVVSHLHWDHSGGIPTLSAAGVPVMIHGDELAFARSGAAQFGEGFRPQDWSAPFIRWQQVAGDSDIAPGVSVVTTPGHTPGHLSFAVRLPQTGTWWFAGDAADLGQNLIDRIACGYCAGGRPEDERTADHSLARLLELADTPDSRLIPGHDPVIINAIRHPTGGHR